MQEIFMVKETNFTNQYNQVRNTFKEVGVSVYNKVQTTG